MKNTGKTRKSERKAITGILLTAFLLGLLTLVFNFHPAKVKAQVIDNEDTLYVPPGETYTLDGGHAYKLYVSVAGTLYVTNRTMKAGPGGTWLYAPEFYCSGVISADGRGWPRNTGPGHAELNDENGGAGGAGYGGDGGDGGGSPGDGGSSYGDPSTYEIQMGSGGSDSHGGAQTWFGGDGGGAIRLDAPVMVINGIITAKGDPGKNGEWAAGAGSGGGILIRGDSVEISGTLSVDGGKGGDGSWGGGGGGGGRIKIFYDSYLEISGSTLSYAGGPGGSGTWPGGSGQDGTCIASHRPFRIPTLTQWGLIVLLVVLAGIATWVVLKRRRVVTA